MNMTDNIRLFNEVFPITRRNANGSIEFEVRYFHHKKATFWPTSNKLVWRNVDGKLQSSKLQGRGLK